MPKSATFRELLDAARAGVEPRLEALFAEELRDAAPLGAEVGDMVDAVRALTLRGGKRLRAGLVFVGCRVAEATRGDAPSSSAVDETALEFGVALELLQTFFLIHDDWIDQDDTRRGGPSAHALLSERWGSRRRGEAGAILAGDYAAGLARAVAALAGEGQVSTTLRRELLGVFWSMERDAIRGQQLDLMGRAESVELVYRLKTASYTVRGPLQLGALLGSGAEGKDERLLALLAAYSEQTGIAFQLADDGLSVFGDPAQTGKPFASDLREGKRTWLLRWALAEARGKARSLERARLKAVVGKRGASESALRDAVAALETLGAREALDAEIARQLAGVDATLRADWLPAPAAALLRDTAEVLARRRA